MTALDSYHDLTEQGFNFWLEQGALKCHAPKGKMTADILAWLKTHKKELISLLATNDHHEKIVVKPVIQKTVRQFDEVSTNGESLKPTTEKLAVEMQEVFPSSNHYPKSAVENSRLTQSEEVYPHIEDRPPTWSMDRYAHMVKCQQCEHLTSTGYCRVKPLIKPTPHAMRDCVSFETVQGERVAIANAPYSVTELNDLLSRYEKKLFYHLVDCVACSFMESRYCVDAFAIGSSYDAMLLVFDAAASKREALLNAVIRARISGRSVFVGLDYANIGEPQQQAVKPIVYGIGDSERPFVNHVMACKQCKPANRTYCDEGLKLKAKADSNSV